MVARNKLQYTATSMWKTIDMDFEKQHNFTSFETNFKVTIWCILICKTWVKLMYINCGEEGFGGNELHEEFA